MYLMQTIQVIDSLERVLYTYVILFDMSDDRTATDFVFITITIFPFPSLQTTMSLSAHLVDQLEEKKPNINPYNRSNQPQNPNPMQVKQDPDQSWYSNHGDTSMQSNACRVTTWSEERVEQLQARLRRKLGPEYVTQRPGPGGGPKLR